MVNFRNRNMSTQEVDHKHAAVFSYDMNGKEILESPGPIKIK